MPLKVELDGVKELTKYFKKFPVKSDVQLRREIEKSATAIKNQYKSGVKWHRKTGKLDESIMAGSNDNWNSAEIGSDIEYAKYIEFGTRPHPINHPGTKADPQLLKAWISVIGFNSVKFIKRIIQRFNKIK